MSDFIVKMTSKGQLTIPKEIRDTMKMNKGDYLIFHIDGDKIQVEKAQISGQSSFDKLTKEVEQQFINNKVTLQDIDKARKWANE